jgi:hypothetical protein
LMSLRAACRVSAIPLISGKAPYGANCFRP